MKEETKFRIWKFKKHELERIKRACDFNLFINKKDENSY